MLVQYFSTDALNILHFYKKIYFPTGFNTVKNKADCSHIIEINHFFLICTHQLTVFKFYYSTVMNIAYETGVITCVFLLIDTTSLVFKLD